MKLPYTEDKMNWCAEHRKSEVLPILPHLIRAAIAEGAGCRSGFCPICWYRYGRAVPSALGYCEQTNTERNN